MNDTLKTIDALPDLLPCPLCRSSMIGSDNCGTLNRIFCYDCGLQLDTAFEADGTSRWNRRAASLRWTRVEDGLPERRPDVAYSCVRCLVTRKGFVSILCFNHEHEVWDDEECDDYECGIYEVEAWMPLPQPFTEDTDEQR